MHNPINVDHERYSKRIYLPTEQVALNQYQLESCETKKARNLYFLYPTSLKDQQKSMDLPTSIKRQKKKKKQPHVKMEG